MILVHHNPLDSAPCLRRLYNGLVDARALQEVLAPIARGLVLFGHLHVRRRSRLTTATGTLEVVCASGASIEHPDERIRAGFNLYTLRDEGDLSSAEAWVLDPETLELCRGELPIAEEMR